MPQPIYTENNDATLLELFPEPGTIFGRGGDEVNGLSLDTVPKGNLLGSIIHHWDKDRVFHLVQANHEYLFVRICTAMPSSGYDAFAVIHDRASVASPAGKKMLAWFEDNVQCGSYTLIPKDVHPTIGNAVAYRDQVLAAKSDHAYGM